MNLTTNRVPAYDDRFQNNIQTNIATRLKRIELARGVLDKDSGKTGEELGEDRQSSKREQ